MARSADSGLCVDEFVHSTVAKTSIIRVTVVTSKTTFVGYESAEIIMLITPVVEVVHESFKVVDHTECGSEEEFNISVGEDHMIRDNVSLIYTVDK